MLYIRNESRKKEETISTDKVRRQFFSSFFLEITSKRKEWFILTHYGNICGEHPRRMCWNLAHIQARVILLHGIYVQAPIVGILKCNLKPWISRVSYISDR